jgi:hypothetical protein
MTGLLDRALAAEEEVERLREREADLLKRLQGVLGSDPTTAVRALSWMHRAENGEQLIREIVREAKVGQGIRSTDLPSGWLARAEAQIKALDILRRDQAELMERPTDGEAWETQDGKLIRRAHE